MAHRSTLSWVTIRRISLFINGSNNNPFSHSVIYIEAETCVFVLEKFSGLSVNRIICYSTPSDGMVMSRPSYHFDTPLVEGMGTLAKLAHSIPSRSE